MFGQTTILIAIIGLVMLSAGGVAYVLLYGRLRAERNVAARMAQVGAGSAALKQAKPRMDAARRRKSVQETLKEIEEKQKAKARQRSTPSLSMRLTQAGLSWFAFIPRSYNSISLVAFTSRCRCAFCNEKKVIRLPK